MLNVTIRTFVFYVNFKKRKLVKTYLKVFYGKCHFWFIDIYVLQNPDPVFQLVRWSMPATNLGYGYLIYNWINSCFKHFIIWKNYLKNTQA